MADGRKDGVATTGSGRRRVATTVAGPLRPAAGRNDGERPTAGPFDRRRRILHAREWSTLWAATGLDTVACKGWGAGDSACAREDDEDGADPARTGSGMK